MATTPTREADDGVVQAAYVDLVPAPELVEPVEPLEVVDSEAPFDPPPVEAPAAASTTGPPLRLAGLTSLEGLRAEQRFPIDLDFVVSRALQGASVIRDPDQFRSPGNPLLASPDQTPSAFDPEIYASGPYGPEAALAAFDTQVAAGMRRDQDALTGASNVLSGGLSTGALTTNTGAMYGRVDRAMGSGGLVSLMHNWDYTPGSVPGRVFNSDYVGFLRAEVRQPLLAGRGPEMSDIAGPAALNRGQLGRGVRVANIDQQIAVLALDLRLQRLLKQAQDAYWDHWLAFETVQRLSDARDSAQALLDRVHARSAAGLAGGAAAEAQAEETVLARQSSLNDALARLLQTEDRLRRLTGLPAGDGRLLTPDETPFEGQVAFDWNASLAIAAESRVELKQQRLRIEALSLQARAAENLMRPRIDLVLGAQTNGFGDDPFGGGYDSLIGGNNLGWNLGTEFSTPLGRRAQRTQLRQVRQRLRKAERVLAAQRDEIEHELAHCFTEIGRTHEAARLAIRRRAAAAKRRRAAEADFEAGRTTVDLVLRAQAAVADAEIEGLRHLAAYNKAIVDLEYREGGMPATERLAALP